MKKLFIVLLLIPFLSGFSQDGNELVKLRARNYYSNQKLGPIIVINLEHKAKWHTYWKNPGDSGLATQFILKVDGKEVEAEMLEWPLPEKHIEQGNIWTYGYEGSQTFFMKMPKETGDLELTVKWLVCKDICIPGEKTITRLATISNNQWPQAPLDYSNTQVQDLIAKLPKNKSLPNDLKLALTKTGDKKLRLHFEWDKELKLKETENFIIGFPSKLISFGHEQRYGNRGYIDLDWIGHYQTPEVSFPEESVLKDPIQLSFILYGTGEAPFITNHQFYQITSENLIPSYGKSELKESTSLLYILLLAFLGGLILNLMPCVLPVISLKLFELIKHKDESRSKIIKHNSFYSLGVILSLLSLALIILGIKSAGQSVGWGFQLQDPLFVSIMIVVLFVMSLNLFGLYEFRTPGGKLFGNIDLKDSYAGDFFSGVLATILSTPCSAPFLGTALTYAFTASTFEILLTFFMIGLGLSFPFLITMFFPAVLKIFPRPGNWMNTLKYFLGLSLLLTMIWLLDVLHSLANSNAIIYGLYPFLTMIFMGVFLYQKAEKGKMITAFSLVGLLFFGYNFMNRYQDIDNKHSELISGNWKAWTPELVDQSVSNNETVFIDFTAKWCLTCQVNKKIVLNTDSFQKYVQEKNIKLYRADWTQRDEKITQFLAKHNRVGVPVYFLIKDGKVNMLGETISLSKLQSFFE